MSAAQIRAALSRRSCPNCHRKALIPGMVFTRHARCMWCEHRVRVRIGRRRGVTKAELTEYRRA